MIYTNIILTVTDEADVVEIKELLREQGRLSRAALFFDGRPARKKKGRP